jgi:hypothetical protein
MRWAVTANPGGMIADDGFMGSIVGRDDDLRNTCCVFPVNVGMHVQFLQPLLRPVLLLRPAPDFWLEEDATVVV